MHIGKLIKEVVRRRGMTVVSFAEQLSCSRANVYKIFDKKSIDTDMLMRICAILQYDFFAAISDNTRSIQSVDMSTDWIRHGEPE
ncbi:MAG: helix-turn-helix domain-containing protein [Candidatus Cryptobacteroides sp.]